jgi:ferredoxin-NADP reductase
MQVPGVMGGTARVVARRDVTADLMIVRLEPDVPFAFTPGQYCTIGVGGVERPYSIVSAPGDPTLELFVERVPGGALTPRLWALRVGDRVALRPRAKGAFGLDARRPVHLMVATVTGIAPFVSMLRATLGGGERALRFHVLHGASYGDELAYAVELSALAGRLPSVLTYVPTISRPDEARNRGWTGAVGRVNRLVEGHVVRHALAPAPTAVYACGHPGMTADVVARLAPRGFRVREERYWPG